MRTSVSNSGRGLKISLAICLPSNNQSWRDEVASPRPKHNRGDLKQQVRFIFIYLVLKVLYLFLVVLEYCILFAKLFPKSFQLSSPFLIILRHLDSPSFKT